MHARGEDRFFEFGSSGLSGVASRLDADRVKQLFARFGRGPWSFDLVYGSRRKSDPTGAYQSDPLVAGQYQKDSYLLTQLQYEEGFAGDSLHLAARLFTGQERYRSILSYGTPFSFPGTSVWRGIEVRKSNGTSGSILA